MSNGLLAAFRGRFRLILIVNFWAVLSLAAMTSATIVMVVIAISPASTSPPPARRLVITMAVISASSTGIDTSAMTLRSSAASAESVR